MKLRPSSFAAVLLLANACSKPEQSPPPPPPRALSNAHPEGPCVDHSNGVCNKRDPKFTAARATAVSADLSGGPLDSGPLDDASLFAVKTTLTKGQRVRVRVELNDPGVHVELRRWEPAPDGWIFSNDGLNVGSLEVTWEAKFDGEQLIAIESAAKTDLRVVVSPVE